MTTLDKPFLGFENFQDLMRQMFKYHQMQFSKLVNIALAMTFIILFIPFLEEWFWTPFWTLIVFAVVLLWDHITAVIANNHKLPAEKKPGYVTEKAKRFPLALVAYITMFVVLHLLAKVIAAFEMNNILNPEAFEYLAKFVYFLCLTINMLSATRHMASAGMLPKQVSDFMQRFIDVHKKRAQDQILDNEPNEAPKVD